MEAQIGKYGYQKLDINNLQDAIDNQFENETATAIDNGDDTFSVAISNSKKTYLINANGNIEYNANLNDTDKSKDGSSIDKAWEINV